MIRYITPLPTLCWQAILFNNLCYVWMEGNEGGVERRGWGRFNEPCLRVFFLSGRGEDLRVLGGVRYPSNPPFLIHPNCGYFEGSGSTYIQRR